MSTSRLETFVPSAGVNKPKSKVGLVWDRLTKPAEEPPYRPLPEYYIRVAKIKPGTKDQPLRVKLKHIDPRSTKYIALSYTWDQNPLPTTDLSRNSSSDSQSTLPGTTPSDKPKTTTLLCGGTPFRVRQNLYDALCQIRDVQCDVPIFVDALCINFNDNAERTKHLEIMGHIYSRAASVIVYLGPKSPGADSTIRIMRQLVNAINWRRIGDAFNGNSGYSGTYNFRDPRFFQSIGMEPLTLRQWRAIRDFCHLRWFTRYWSFFELALAKNALFLWGEACMEYNFLIDFCMILTFSGWLDELHQISTDNLSSSTFDSDGDAALIKMLLPIARLRSSPQWSPKHKDFADWMRENHGLESEQAQAWQFFEILLQCAEPFECHNPLDKMYAPLTLARAIYAGKPMNKTWPTPDYQKSVAEVYGQFAGPIARETGSQSIITGMEGYAGHDQRIQMQNRNESRNGKRNTGRPESANQVRTEDRSRNESRNSTRPGSRIEQMNRTVSANGTPSRARNSTRPMSRNSNGNGNRDDDSGNTPSRSGTAKTERPRSRNGKLISKRASSRNG